MSMRSVRARGWENSWCRSGCERRHRYTMSTWNKHYHWKTKGCTPWAKEWFTSHLVGQKVPLSKDADACVKVDKLTGFEGDVELGNRKGKLITIYECAITLAWSGETEDGTSANGTIKFPEVSHENEDNDEAYLFETELLSESSSAALSMYEVVRKKLVPALEEVFHGFRKDLIESHAKDLGHDDEGQNAAKTSAQAAPSAAAPTPSVVGASRSDKTSGSVSTSAAEVRVASHLAISQADLWDLLTNPLRIPMWSKAPAQFSPNVGANFSLFGGNISGSIVQVTAPTRLTQTWRIPQWPAGHHGTLTTELTQGDDSTKLELVLSGVPLGEEDHAQTGLETYYIRGLKSIGLGTIL